MRFSRGKADPGVNMDEPLKELPIGKGEILREGRDACLIGIGNMVVNAVKAAEILAKEGIVTWAAEGLGMGNVLNAVLAIPVIGGNSLSTSYIGTFLVFLYVWLPFMILPMQAALERVPSSMLEASADLGAGSWRTFRSVILPLALPGVIAGSIFTFSLTMGDYIIPQIVGSSRFFIGQAVYSLQGTAGNIPLAAAFAVVPIVIMLIYLAVARRLGAFDAL